MMGTKVVSNNVKAIVEMEWQLFDKVRNIGGRASCQDDKHTFFIMRSSQLMAWSTEMQDSYYYDLLSAHRDGRNLLSEKYAYMMERTSPEEFQRIQDSIPPRSAQKDEKIAFICEAHVHWQEALAKRYPRLAGSGRSIHQSEDSISNTSLETYLWGELATYSTKTIQLYADYVRRMQREGKNLSEMILENTMAMYGFSSLEQAEEELAFRSS